MARRGSTLLVLAWLVAATGSAAGSRPLTVIASLPSGPLSPGTVADLVVTTVIEPGWHIYSATQPAGGPMPTTVELGQCPGLRAAGRIVQTGATTREDPVLGMTVESLAGLASLTIPVRLDEEIEPGRHTCRVLVRYQACDGRSCLMPQEETAEVAFTVAAPAKSAEPASTVPPGGSRSGEVSCRGVDGPPSSIYRRLTASDNGDARGPVRLLECLPSVLDDRTFDGEEAYFAGVLWRRLDEHLHGTAHDAEVASSLAAYLASPGPHAFEEPARAELVACQARLGRLEDAMAGFAALLEGQPSAEAPAIEHAREALVDALRAAGRWSDLEAVEASAGRGATREERHGPG